MKQKLISLASRAYLKISRVPQLVVMTFHRVGEKQPITPAHIRHHMAFLARHYEMIVPSQVANGKPPARAAMVTIDDSHRDLYEHIFPVAQSLNVPITICVPTDYFFRNRWLWFDRLYWVLERATAGAEAQLDGQWMRVGDVQSVAKIKAILKRKMPADRDRALESIEKQLRCVSPPAPADGYEPVLPVEMQGMLASGLVEICAHTVSHTIATVLPDQELKRELAQGKDELEKFTGRKVASFCYPNGEAGDFDDRTTQAVQAAGFGAALTSVEGINRMAGLDPYRILRIHAHPQTSTFEKEASCLGEWRRRFAGANNQ